MEKSPHEQAMRRAFINAGGQHYRREVEVRREADVEKEERDAAGEWLRHVEAARIGNAE
jgi:hypothetical protein